MNNSLTTLALLMMFVTSNSVFAKSAIGEAAPIAVNSRILSLYKNPPTDLITYTYKIDSSPFWAVVINSGELLVISNDGTTLISVERSKLTFQIYEKGNQGYIDASSDHSQSYSARKLPTQLRAKLNRTVVLDALGANVLKANNSEGPLGRAYNFKRAPHYWMLQTQAGKVIIDSETGLLFLTARNKGVISLMIVNANNDPLNIINDDIRSNSIADALMSISNTIDFVAPNEQTVRYVFTDPFCGYCRKLHNQMDDLNEKGITVRYIPINNFGNRSLDPVLKLLAVETENQPNALSYMKRQLSTRQTIDYNVIGSPKVTEQTREQLRRNKAIGNILGVRGTPAIFDTSGKSSRVD